MHSANQLNTQKEVQNLMAKKEIFYFIFIFSGNKTLVNYPSGSSFLLIYFHNQFLMLDLTKHGNSFTKQTCTICIIDCK